MRVNVRLEDVETLDELKAAKREVRKTAKEGMAAAGQDVALPRIRTGVHPRFLVPYLTVKATSARAFLTTQGPIKYDRILGLQNFGGTVTTPILPKHATDGHAPALSFRGTHQARASVTTPRHYRGKHFLERDLAVATPEMADATLPYLMQAFSGLPHEP